MVRDVVARGYREPVLAPIGQVMSTVHRPRSRAVAGALILATLVPALACDSLGSSTSNSPTSPTTPTTTTTVTESFAGAVSAQGKSVATFTVTQSGQLTVTLSAVTPATTLGIGYGTPTGTTCNLTSSNTATAGAGAQISVTVPAGTYCVSVYDTGLVTATTTFNLTVSHN